MRRLVLAFILLAYLALAALYAIFTPKWQVPDEPAHFNYIRAIAETGALPVLQRGDYDQAYLEQIKAAKFPATMSIDAIRYESYQPPLYYLAATPVYLLTRGAGLDAQVVALRLFSVLLEVLALVVAFAIVRAIFSDDHLLALATVGAIATVPMHIAITASISNDTAAELVIALIVLLAVRRAQNVISHRRFAICGGLLFGAALLTKTTLYVPGALLLLGAEIANAQERGGAGEQGGKPRLTLDALRLTLRVSRFTPLALLFLLSSLIFLPWLARGALTYGITDPLGIARHDAVVIGQPTTAEMIARYGLNHIAFDYVAVTFKSFWAQFGWMGVLVNDRIYVALFLLSALAAFGFTLYIFRALRRRDALTSAQAWSMLLLALVLVAAVADYLLYNLKFFQLQGRYLYPAIIPLALFGVIGLREILAREYQRLVFALVYVGMLALDAMCLFVYIVPQLKS